MLNIESTDFKDLLVINHEIFDDNRGFFFESYNKKLFDSALNKDIYFVQDNNSFSNQGVIRGLHFQLKTPQAKLVRVANGSILDVVVDLREDQPSFLNFFTIELSRSNRKMLWVPEGFAHGFQVLSKNALVCYKTTEFWSKDDEYTLRYDDPTLNIPWKDIKTIISDKDANGKDLKEITKILKTS
tara:strand:+ start:122 stop:676 length:555 start_codon:yes stop_codon:yes gene_type:complete